MPPLLTLDAVAAAVVRVAESGGAPAVNARAVARELHISVGALYNYAGSMAEALEAADHVVLDRLRSALGRRTGDDRLVALLDWVNQNRGVSSVLFDPGRRHGRGLDELAPLDPVDAGDMVAGVETLEIFRVWVGLALRSRLGLEADGTPSPGPELDLRTIGEALPRLFAQLGQRGEADIVVTDIRGDGAAWWQAFEHMVTASGERNERRRTVRTLSARLLVGGPTSVWSFRQLAERSGTSLAGLHALGNRQSHLRDACADIVAASVLRALDAVDPANPLGEVDEDSPRLNNVIPVLAEVGDSRVFEETLDRIREASGATLSWCSVPVVTMFAAMFIASFHRHAEHDPDDIAWTHHMVAEAVRFGLTVFQSTD